MNHGGLGYIEIAGDTVYLGFPPELLEHSFVRRDGVMYGIYYLPRDTEDYGEILVKHDLMLTPIPHRFWSRAARLNLRIRHQPGMIHKISEFLARNRTSILHSESTRSGYRYENWSFYIVFEDLVGNLDFDPEQSVYLQTIARLDELEYALNHECRSALFFDEKDIDLSMPVTALHNTALAYFHNYVQVAKNDSKLGWLFDPFEMKCTGTGMLECSNGDLAGILKSRERMCKEKLVPTVVFTGLDTRYLNLRTAIIPQDVLPRFFQLVVEYTRSGQPDSCCGLISSLTDLFPPGYNVWSSHNRTLRSTEKSERGSMVFLIEDRSKDFRSAGATIEEASSRLSDLNSTISLPEGVNIVFEPPSVRPVTLENVRRTVGEQLKGRGTVDIFISYCHKDVKVANDLARRLEKAGLKCFVAPHVIEPGNPIDDEVFQAIRDCKEICVLWTESSLLSYWVHTEWGAARVLNKKIVGVLYGITAEKLPGPLRMNQVVEFHDEDLGEYARLVRMRIDSSQIG
jgi:hypothetical protein